MSDADKHDMDEIKKAAVAIQLHKITKTQGMEALLDGLICLLDGMEERYIVRLRKDLGVALENYRNRYAQKSSKAKR